MKSLKDYLTESQQIHEYIIRFAQKPSDVDMDMLEDVLKKFDLQDCSAPERIQNTDLDFFDIPYREIYQVRVATSVKLSPYVLLQDLRTALNLNEKQLRVRGANDPMQAEAEQAEWQLQDKQDAIKKSWRPQAHLSTERDYMSQEQPASPVAYGNDYNKNLLSYLNAIAQDRAPNHVDAENQLFGWLDMDKHKKANPDAEATDFNSQYDTPKAQQKPSKDFPMAPWLLGTNTFSNAAQPKIKAWRDDKDRSHVQVQPQKGSKKL